MDTTTAEQTKRQAEETYNRITDRQRTLTAEMDEAVKIIVDNMKEKLSLAHRQDVLQGELGCAYPNLFPMAIRTAIAEELARRLLWEVPPTGPVPLSLRDIDWSCKRVQAGFLVE